MIIRTANTSDIPTLRKLYLELEKDGVRYQPEHFVIGTRTDEFFQSIFTSPTQDILVAEENDEVLGFVHVMIIPQKKVSCLKPQTTVYMQDLCVSPDKRNGGIGTRLVREAKAYGKAHGADFIRTQVFPGNVDGMRFYERNGFCEMMKTIECQTLEPKIKAVIFDMFETLVTLFEGKTYFSENIAQDLGVPLQEFRKHWHATEKERTLGKYTMAEGLGISLKNMGCYSEENVRLVVEKRHSALQDTFNAIPEASVKLLQNLHERGILIGLITNTFSDERDLIKTCPLFPFFDVALISYEQGLSKPDPEMYKRMITKLGVKPDECLYVGDGGSRELYGARNAGMQAVQCTWFHERAFEPHIPCPLLDDFPHADTQEDILKYID